VNFGFDWSATRKIAVQRGNRDLVNQTVASVWGAKAMLCVVTAVILLILVRSVPRLREGSLLLFILYGSVVGNAMFPTWLFQGLERMTVISVTNLGIRTIGALAIFLFIRRPSDFLLFAVVLSAQGLGAGLVGAAAAFKIFGLRLVLPSWRGVHQEITDSSPFFFTTAAISLYTSGNAFVLGLLTNPATVGYYSAAEKIVMAVAGLLAPLSQAVYPQFSRLARQSKTQAMLWARRMLALTGGGGILLSALLFVGASLIVRVILGPKFAPSAAVIAIMSPLPALVAISNVLGVQILFPFGREKQVLTIVVAAGIVNLMLALLLAPHWYAPGMATAVLVSEIVVTIGYFGCTWLSNLNPLGIS